MACDGLQEVRHGRTRLKRGFARRGSEQERRAFEGAQPDAGVREGDVIADKYQVQEILGAGGTGIVVEARHVHLDERVALKFLRPEAIGDGEAVARLVREVRADGALGILACLPQARRGRLRLRNVVPGYFGQRVASRNEDDRRDSPARS